MATQDESVANLERFIGVLTSTIEDVHGDTSTLDDHADAIEDLDSDGQSALEDLSDALTEFEEDLQGAETDALAQVQELRETAREGASTRLGRAESEVEQAGNDFTSAIEDGRARVDEAHGELDGDGFDRFEQSMETVEGGLAEDRQQAETAFDQLDSVLADASTRAATAFTDAEAGFDQTNETIGDQQASIVTDAGDGVRALDGVGDDIDGYCRTKAAALVGLYTGWTGEVTTEAQELVTAVEQLATETATAVDSLTDDEVNTPAETVVREALDPYLAELAELNTALDDARGPAGELPPLVDDLEKAMAVVDQIAQLLQALE